MSLLPILTNFVRSNPRFVILPVAIVVGFVGVNIEGWLRSSSTSSAPETMASSLSISSAQFALSLYDVLKADTGG